MEQKITFAEKESERFARKVARLRVVTKQDLEILTKALALGNVDLAIIRMPPSLLRWSHLLHRIQGELITADVLVWYEYELGELIVSDTGDERLAIRPAEMGDIEGIDRITEDAFEGYTSHYHANPRLGPVNIAEIYGDWNRSQLASYPKTGLFLATWKDVPSGFVSWSMDGSKATLELSAVKRSLSQNGIYQHLLSYFYQRMKERGVKNIRTPVLLENERIQRILLKNGWNVGNSEVTFHWNKEGYGDNP